MDGTRKGQRGALALFFPATAAFAPLGLRLWRLLAAGSGIGPEDVLGIFSDVLCGVAFLVVIRACPRLLRLIPALLWALFQFGSVELFQALGRYPVWQDFHYLFDADFVKNSVDGLKLSAPVFTALLFAAALLTAVARLPRMSLARFIAWTLLLAALFYGHARLDRLTPGDRPYARCNPLHWLARDAIAGIRHRTNDAPPVELPPSLRQADLAGASLLGEGGGRARNVLIMALEGIPGLYIPEIREAMGVSESTVTMPKLAEAAKDAMLIPDFTAHSHQTIRGLYAMLCGDFSKLSWDTPKAFELQNAPERAAACLPAQLAKQGWATHYLQAAGLGFMAKDRVMAQAGFGEIHGSEWFAGQNIQNAFPFEWGMEDAAFFRGARRYIEDLRQGEKPWMLALLTVGTHQPYAAPDDIAAKYPSRKDAATALLDAAVAEFLHGLRTDGVFEDTLIIVTSDESHGSPLAPWVSAWGLGLVFAPEIPKLPRLKRGGYGLVDVEASVLDYLGLPPPPGVIGRSFFRDYESPREMFSFTAGALRRQSGNLRIECAGEGLCQGGEAAGILGAPPENMRPIAPELAAETRAIAQSMDNVLKPAGGEQVFRFASGEQRRLDRQIGNDWSDNLVGAQYLDFPKNSEVEVRMRITLLEGPAAGAPFRLLVKEADQDKHDVPLPELPRLQPGESMEQSFRFHNERARKSFSFHLLADAKEGAVRIDRFDGVIRQRNR